MTQYRLITYNNTKGIVEAGAISTNKKNLEDLAIKITNYNRKIICEVVEIKNVFEKGELKE